MRRISVCQHRLVRHLLSIVALLTVIGSCSSSEAGSNTPRLEASGSAEGLPLLTPKNVQQLALPPHEFTSLEGVDAFENPDPRGPCGGTVPNLPTRSASGVAIVSPSFTLINLSQPASDDAVTFHDAVKSDAKRPCEPYESLTNEGLTQSVDEVEYYQTSDGRALAWTSAVTVGGETFQAGAATIRTDSSVSFVQVMSPGPIEPQALLAIVDVILAEADAVD
jgi:hypothetical protein